MILLVEDDPDIAEAAREVLEEDGHQVVRVGNGLQALQLLKNGQRPALVLLDLMMPVMNGWEVLQSMQAEAELASIPVVLTTAVRKPRLSGACGYLRKPYDLDDLRQATRKYCAPALA